VSRATFWLLPWRSRSQHDLAAKSCPAHNFVILSRISKIFYRNDHYIETTCCAHHLGRNLEGQGHSMTLQQNRVRPITLFFWSQIPKQLHRNDHHIETTCRVQHLGCYLEGQGHSMTFQQNCVRPITLLFEVRFWNYFTWLITIFTWRVVRNIWVATLKVKVTAWPFSKIAYGP